MPTKVLLAVSVGAADEQAVACGSTTSQQCANKCGDSPYTDSFLPVELQLSCHFLYFMGI